MNKITKKKFRIKGMHCVSCAMSIDFDLEDLEGIKKSNTNYANCVCEVEYEEEKLKPQDILETIKKTGYQAEPVEDISL